MGGWTITGTFTNDTYNFIAITTYDNSTFDNNGKYFISSNGNLILNSNNSISVNNYYLSTNGRILVITNPIRNVSSALIWLDKQ